MRSYKIQPLTMSVDAALLLALIVAIVAIYFQASQDFFEKYTLLLSTAGLTGLLVPYILKVIDNRKQREQKQYEAELTRQSKIIDAQVQLMERLSDALWEYQLLAITVTYYQSYPDLYTV